MVRRDEVVLPSGATAVVEQLLAHFGDRPGLAWMYGQGSVFTRIRDDSDLDVILVWAQLPTAATLPETFTSRFAAHEDIALEKSRIEGYEVDLMHVPRRVFDDWVTRLDQGDGWSGNPWPDPIHVAAGLAEGVMLLDCRGDGAAYQRQLQTPSPILVRRVTDQLGLSVPGYLEELRRSAARGHRWLFASLSGQLHRLIYLTWFLAEGHFPPFPKYLPEWFARFDMDIEIRHLEEECWAAATDPDEVEAIARLAHAVLDLAERSLPGA